METIIPKLLLGFIGVMIIAMIIDCILGTMEDFKR